ncbi:hypothetical protein [Nocardia cyriacigeorgica]|uniref:Uncharacterized protein n=1 Tax=Nocardia cyriacigeorgica TaxID=135487 RepID=A0A5R8NEI1_9NOCA|nr:hypothetical protein [Nocardia cyriacigeorgica]TLF74024.1 hypothetical protein FEK34_25200 [Nocardia cyriacigeorgica]
MIGWDLAAWDISRWRPSTVAARGRKWVCATRRRRWTVSLLGALFALFVFPGLVGAVATAGTSNLAASSAANSALSSLGVRDSSGVELADYMFVVNIGNSLFNPAKAAVGLVIGLIFAGWLVIVGAVLWLLGWVLSFVWLDLIGNVMKGVANSFTNQIATSIMLVTAVTIGAVIVGVFLARGLHAKAASQIVTMVGVAMLGPIFLADPLADILSSHGVLIQGRDLGLSVAAGLHGNSAADPDQLVASMNADAVDNFARKPLQVWNFGYVLDTIPGCKQAWSDGIRSGSGNTTRDLLENCGDGGYAYAMSSEPTVGQVGAGILILLSALIMMYFAAYMAIRIIWAALDAIYHGFMMIFGLAAGGFIYGPTQTFMARNAADALIAGARMAINTVFLSLYLLILGKVFEQAGGQVIPVLVIGSIVQVVGVAQLGRLNNSLTRGNEWIAQRFSSVMQGGRSGAGAGGGGGSGGSGMGLAGVTNSMGPGAALLAGMGAVSTINNSPVAAWLLGSVSPLNPAARRAERMRRTQIAGWTQSHMAGAYPASFLNRVQFAEAAREGLELHAAERIRGWNTTANTRTPDRINIPSGVDTARGAAIAIQWAVEKGGAGEGDLLAALEMSGFTDHQIMMDAIGAHVYGERRTQDEPAKAKPLAKVEALTRQFESNPTEANLYALEMAAVNLRTQRSGGVALTPAEEAIANQYLADPDLWRIKELQRRQDGLMRDQDGNEVDNPYSTEEGRISAGRIMSWLDNGYAMDILRSVDRINETPLRDIQEGAARRQAHDAVRELRRQVGGARRLERHTQGEGATGTDIAPPRPRVP